MCPPVEYSVGSGSAGAVVANRLSKKFRVLLLEAGGKPDIFSQVPFLKSRLEGSRIDYAYKTVPQKYAFAYIDQVSDTPSSVLPKFQISRDDPIQMYLFVFYHISDRN